MASIFEPIQMEVCQWSKENFGQQQSKVNPDMFLGSLAPMLGIIEEAGEWVDAKDDEEEQDAIGDIMIYLCDYAGREGFILPDVSEQYITNEDPVIKVMRCLGELSHCTLKRHQGIRGFDDHAKYIEARNNAVQGIMDALQTYVEYEHDMELIDVVSSTWEAIVKKRNWKRNNQEG